MNSIDDVRNYMRELRSRSTGRLALAFDPDRPSDSDEELARLGEAIPGLARDYISVARALPLAGTPLGSFFLSPSAKLDRSVAQQILRQEQDDREVFTRPLRELRLIGVARREADIVAVALTDGPRPPGSVWMIGGHVLPPEPVSLAPDFLVFVLLAAELNAAIGDSTTPAQVRREAFLGRARVLISNTEAIQTWERIADDSMAD